LHTLIKESYTELRSEADLNVSVPVTHKIKYYVTCKDDSYICIPNIYVSDISDQLYGDSEFRWYSLKPTVFRIENAFQMNLKMFIFGNVQLYLSN